MQLLFKAREWNEQNSKLTEKVILEELKSLGNYISNDITYTRLITLNIIYVVLIVIKVGFSNPVA